MAPPHVCAKNFFKIPNDFPKFFPPYSIFPILVRRGLLTFLNIMLSIIGEDIWLNLRGLDISTQKIKIPKIYHD